MYVYDCCDLINLFVYQLKISYAMFITISTFVCKGVCSLTHGWNAPYTQTKEASNNAPITFNIIWIMAALYFDVFVIFSA